MKYFLKKLLYPEFRKKLFFRILKMKNAKNFAEIVKNPEYKNILVADSGYYYSILRQRPQHLAKYLANKFDLVIYPTVFDGDFEFITERLLLSPIINFEELKKKNCWVMLFSHSITVNKDINKLIKLKKDGVHIIYDYIDDFADDIAWNKKGNSYKVAYNLYMNLEKLDPDLIVTTAKNLYDEMAQRFPNKNILRVANGVNVEDFENPDNTVIPDDMKSILENKKPIVGYYGFLAKWNDFDLMNKTAEYYPNYNFVYIGPNPEKGLKRLSNVYLLGRKEYHELPLYAQYFDCCMIPFKNGEVALKTSPVKLFEYMALQKPVVCTRDLIECRGYEGVLMSENDEEFIKNIKIAIDISKDEKIRNKLLEQAKQNSWENKAKAIIDNLNI